MESLLIWWLTIQALGLSALPLSRYVFRWLPDQGYVFAKPLGILICSYALWMGASLGVVDNDRVTIVAIVVLFGAASWAGLTRRAGDLGDWWRQNRAGVVVVELLFAVGLVFLAVLRAYDAPIAFTEKPMEFAFLNSIVRSERFPPVDPWMSGHSISYYYFGYVIVAVLTKLSGLATSYTFNLAVAALFALTLTGTFSVVYNLVRLSMTRSEVSMARAVGFGLVGCVLMGLLGNLEGLIEVLNSKGFIPTTVHSWLHIKELPLGSPDGGWLPIDNWWWWRASRVIGDFDPLTQVSRDYTINEFPFFSFLLGDLHPHVLALPFAITCLALALNLVASREETGVGDMLGRRRLDFLVWVLLLGGLGFLNSWDLPTYLLVVAVAFGLRQFWITGAFRWREMRETLLFALVAVVAAVVLYFPFYLTFSSQAQGIGLVPVRTKLHHLLIFWAPFGVLIIGFLLVQLSAIRQWVLGAEVPAGSAYQWSLRLLPGLLVSLLAAMLILSGAEVLAIVLLGLAVVVHLIWSALTGQQVALRARVQAWALQPPDPQLPTSGSRPLVPDSWPLGPEAPLVFALVLIGVSLALLAGSEVLFLRDLFGNRMNTVFKVYYQVWTMLAIASAFALFHLISPSGWSRKGLLGSAIRWASVGLFVVVAMACLVYPVSSSIAKSNGFARAPEFDGTLYLKRVNPSDYEAIKWLQSSVQGTPVIVEAAGESYTQYARISANTGLPTVVGWGFHEHQWRGSHDEAAQRKADVELIYKTTDIDLARRLLSKYGATYVYIGSLERDRYGGEEQASLQKFAKFMDVAYRNSGVIIYQVRGQLDE